MSGHQITTSDHALQFMLAGNATLTIKSLKSGDHLTYTVKKPKPNKAKPNGPTHFVKVRTGNDFAYLGFITSERGFVHGGHKADLPFNSPECQAFRWTMANLENKHMPELLQIWHEGTCGRCGRPLTHPDSIASGIGPECATKMECI